MEQYASYSIGWISIKINSFRIRRPTIYSEIQLISVWTYFTLLVYTILQLFA